jgi:predicted GNAT family N-acyltransferase
MVETKWLFGTQDIKEALDIRYDVFVREQGVAEGLEKDEMDAYARHILVYDNKTPVATGRLYLDGSRYMMGRIAVRKDFRGKGYGDLVVRVMLLKAFELGADEVHIHAQMGVRGFYEKRGFTAYGEPYMEAGIPHINMKITKEQEEGLFHSCCGK